MDIKAFSRFLVLKKQQWGAVIMLSIASEMPIHWRLPSQSRAFHWPSSTNTSVPWVALPGHTGTLWLNLSTIKLSLSQWCSHPPVIQTETFPLLSLSKLITKFWGFYPSSYTLLTSLAMRLLFIYSEFQHHWQSCLSLPPCLLLGARLSPCLLLVANVIIFLAWNPSGGHDGSMEYRVPPRLALGLPSRALSSSSALPSLALWQAVTQPGLKCGSGKYLSTRPPSFFMLWEPTLPHLLYLADTYLSFRTGFNHHLLVWNFFPG